MWFVWCIEVFDCCYFVIVDVVDGQLVRVYCMIVEVYGVCFVLCDFVVVFWVGDVQFVVQGLEQRYVVFYVELMYGFVDFEFYCCFLVDVVQQC